jgi:hypothetical protein
MKWLKRLFCRHTETDEEMKQRILKLTDGKDYGLCSPPMNAQVAVNELAHYLLGKDWYIATPMNGEQANTEIVYAIESKYRKVR